MPLLPCQDANPQKYYSTQSHDAEVNPAVPLNTSTAWAFTSRSRFITLITEHLNSLACDSM